MTIADPMLTALVVRAGLGHVVSLAPLMGGANNRVFRANCESGPALVKCYFRHPLDPRDRLQAEVAFSAFAQAAGVRVAPRLLGHDSSAGIGLFEWIEGSQFLPGMVTTARLEQAIDFARTLNLARWRPAVARLPNASEACWSLEEHLGTVAGRVQRLMRIQPANTLEKLACLFVRSELAPEWAAVQTEARESAIDNGLSLHRELTPVERCISPSDFGFHNALLEPGNVVRFLDFEYAGWDDPAKLVCDFFCQPAIPVPFGACEAFTTALAECFPDPEMIAQRVRVLLPVYQMKWVCIRLNNFLPVGNQRRAFALPLLEREEQQQRQLIAAQTALAEIRSRMGSTT